MAPLALFLAGGALLAALFRWWRPEVSWRAAALFLVLAFAFFAAPLATRDLQVPVDIAYQWEPWREATARLQPANPLLSDVPLQMLPLRTLVRERLLRFEAPLWSHELGAGEPLLGNAQAAPFAPLHLLALPLPPEKALSVAAAWQVLLALLGTYALALALGAGRYGAVRSGGVAFGAVRSGGVACGAALASLAYAFSAFAVAWAYYPMGMAAAWVPGFFLGLLAAARGERGAVAGLAVFAAGLATSGHPETLAHASVGAALVAAALLARGAIDRAGFLRRTALAAALALCLAAPALAPMVQALPESLRADILHRTPDAVQPPPFRARILAPLVDPLVHGSPRDGNAGGFDWNEIASGYAGLLTLALAVGAAVAGSGRPRQGDTEDGVDGVDLRSRAVDDPGGRRGRAMDPVGRSSRLADPGGLRSRAVDMGGLRCRAVDMGGRRSRAADIGGRRCRAAFGAGLLALLVALRVPPFFQAMRVLPLVGGAAHARLRLFWVLGLALAAGLGVERLALTRRGRLAGALSILAAVVALVLLPPPDALWERAWFWAVLAGAAAALAALLVPRLRPAFPAVVLAAVALELALLGWRYNPVVRSDLDLSPPPALAYLIAASRGPEAPFRVSAEGADLMPELPAIYGLWDVRGNDPMRPAAAARMVRQALQPGDRPMSQILQLRPDVPQGWQDYLGIRYLLTRHRRRLPSPWQPVLDDQGGKVWRNPQALPLFFMPRAIAAAPRDEAARRAAANADFAALGLVEEEAASPPQPQQGTVVIRRVRPNGFDLRIASPTGGLVTSSVSAASGWSLEIDGRAVPLQRVNGGFLGFRAPPGDHRARLEYRPIGWTVGWVMAAVAGLAGSLGAMRSLRLRRRAESSGVSTGAA